MILSDLGFWKLTALLFDLWAASLAWVVVICLGAGVYKRVVR